MARSQLLREIQKKNPGKRLDPSADEIVITCPKCKHPRFYFNLSKGVGHCQRGRCHWSPTARSLLKFWGIELESAPGLTFSYQPESVVEAPVELPPEAHQLLEKHGGQLCSHCDRCQVDAQKLFEARGIDYETQYRFRIHATSARIFVPVYSEGALALYVARIKFWEQALWKDALKYKYPPDVNKADFLFNWDALKVKKSLVLVENTFNAIWLNKLNATTSFGSQLSKKQIEKISRSRAETVVVLWDEDAYPSAVKVSERLRNSGVLSHAVVLSGEPEQYSYAELEQIVGKAERAARNPWAFSS